MTDVASGHERQVWLHRAGRALIYLALAVITVSMVYPFWLMISLAFRSQSQYASGRGYSLASWRQLFESLPIGHQLLNSTIVAISAILVILVVSTTAAYAFGSLRFRGSGPVFLLVASAMMVPMESLIVPEYVNLAHLGLVNNYLGAILVYAALGTPFATFLLTSYFRSVPEDVIEASLIDGLSYKAIFVRIMLPLALPAIATVTVLQFIQIWDDLLVGLLFLQNPVQRTITVGLATLGSQHSVDIPVLMAGSLISALPAIVVYLVFQRYLISGLTMGMSK
jgi:ABC-type glycerol-3-phosphate transport system permease component